MAHPKRRMTMLEMYAHHGSTSYGPITAERLRSILLGDEPSDAERARAEQAVLEMPLHEARVLADELGITFAALDARAVALFGRGIEDSHSIVSELISLGLSARYGNRDPKGLAWARQELVRELTKRGWVLPPHRHEGDDPEARQPPFLED